MPKNVFSRLQYNMFHPLLLRHQTKLVLENSKTSDPNVNELSTFFSITWIFLSRSVRSGPYLSSFQLCGNTVDIALHMGDRKTLKTQNHRSESI